MPVYVFKCPQCGDEIEEFLSIREYVSLPRPMCTGTACENVKMCTQLQPTALAFKGAGWTPKFEGGAGLGVSTDISVPKRAKKRGKT